LGDPLLIKLKMFRGGFGAPTHKTEAEKEEEERLRRVVEERIQQRREELKNNKGSFWSKWTADTSSKDGVNSSQVAERYAMSTPLPDSLRSCILVGVITPQWDRLHHHFWSFFFPFFFFFLNVFSLILF
jgi:hypothetical protein